MIRIMVADDEMLERAVLCKILKKNLESRCVVFQAENGREALDVYEEQKIQIAVLDIEMPGINGIEVAEQIRRKDKECCIIFLTAFDEFAYAKKAITVRALDYLLKPYEEQELMLVVEEAVRLAEEQEKGHEAAQGMRKAAGTSWGEEPGREYLDGQEGHEESGNSRIQKAGKGKDLNGQEEHEESGNGPGTEEMPEGDFENSRLLGVKEMIERFIRENYMYDISMQDLAHTMNYSDAYFCKLFKQCFGRNFISYLTEYRVDAAKKLLEDPMGNIKEIGRAVGYGDSNYFTKVFRRVTGVSPTEYRVRILRGNKER